MNVVSVGDLLKTDLRIPAYQRPYSWEPGSALQLLDDILDAQRDTDRPGIAYVLGTVILYRAEPGQGPLDVVDGQQRLLTLTMILAVLAGESGLAPKPSPESPVGRALAALRRRVEPLKAGDRAALRAFVTERCELVRVVTDDIDEAFRVFDSQNYRGKPLAPHDLLKAHHLRQMSGETEAMRTAVVEGWESVSDNDLDRLFAVFLYRIMRWTRGKAAPKFTAADIGMFKGVAPVDSRSPSARYHLAAQAAIPLLGAWAAPAGDPGETSIGRTRFQLDAPVPAGRAFFEMVSFMLGELRTLRESAFEGWESFASYVPGPPGPDRDIFAESASRSRYRYVSELYLAALLYYTNKFGDLDSAAARQRLFTWAFALRVEHTRVQFRTVDRRAQEAGSAFALLRDATSPRAIFDLTPARSTPDREGHEAPLTELLKTLEER